MAYRFYLGGMMLPVTPESLSVTINNANKTHDIIGLGQINVLKQANLKDISFDILLPSHRYPFSNGGSSPQYYLNRLERMKKGRRKFQFVVTRPLPSGGNLFSTNIKVSLESYTIKEDAKSQGTDVVVNVKLKEFKPYGTKTAVLKTETTPTVTAPAESRPEENSPAPQEPQTYTVKKGDTLWKLAKQFYGNGADYMKIANASGVKNPDLILIGQTLTIPTA